VWKVANGFAKPLLPGEKSKTSIAGEWVKALTHSSDIYNENIKVYAESDIAKFIFGNPFLMKMDPENYLKNGKRVKRNRSRRLRSR
jgi:hypothetical protein